MNSKSVLKDADKNTDEEVEDYMSNDFLDQMQVTF